MQTTLKTLNHHVVIFNYKGEKTQALILDADSYVVGIGEVMRHPSDEPDRLQGEKYALTKALENSKLDRFDRTLIWKAYHGQ